VRASSPGAEAAPAQAEPESPSRLPVSTGSGAILGKKAKKLGCCEKFKAKRGRACKDCPLMESLSKKERRALRERYR
jgi:hypothetical protein